jgi:DNA-binding transcriptional ArsR family regulator
MVRDRLGPVFRALADPTRRGILDLLREAPRSTGEVCLAFPRLSRFGVMKHLRVLEQAGLVLVRREGRVRRNVLNVVPLQEVHERWLRPFEALWASRLLAIRRAAEAATDSGSQAGTLPRPPGGAASPTDSSPAASSLASTSRDRVPGRAVRPHTVHRPKEARS